MSGARRGLSSNLPAMKTLLQKLAMGSALALLLAAPAAADRIELVDGSVINGTLLYAEDGRFLVETTFAGKVSIDQTKVRSFTTEQEVNVGLTTGSAILGRAEADASGVSIVGASGRVAATPATVAQIWRVGNDSPEVRRMKEAAAKAARNWAYEAGVAITGRTGVSEKFGATIGFKATLESSADKLIFSLQAERAQDNGVDTADRQFGSVDYSSFISANNLWYARTSLEKDRIKNLDLRSTTAFGVGRKLIKTERQDLEARVGLSYVYETYADNTKYDAPGGDFALLHTYQFATAKMANALTYTPSFEDFGNYRLKHESTLEMPITASQWKLRVGVANDYLSVPPAGVSEKLDTTYYTSLILNWK